MAHLTFYAIDLTGAGGYASIQWTSEVTGCNGLASAPYPGLAYDYALDRIVRYPNRGNTVYIFDPDAKSNAQLKLIANGPQVTPDSNTQAYGPLPIFPGARRLCGCQCG